MQTISIERELAALVRRVFRTDLSQPGFSRLELGEDGTPEAFRDLLLWLAATLGQAYRQEFGRALTFSSQGRFDQQVSTEAHRDGGPDESVLLLGYEPTTVASQLFVLDHSRAALDRGMTPQAFLERFNPLTPAGKAALADYTTELTGFLPGHYQVVAINNGALPWELRQRGMLGVLHRAIIPAPDLSAHRFVNSFLLSPAAEDFPVRSGN